MKAIVQDGFGSADVLELRDVPDPVIGAGEVLVEVRAAGCGPDVWHLMTGQPYFVRVPCPSSGQMRKAPRGRDVAGVVAGRRPGVTASRAGRRGDGRSSRARSRTRPSGSADHARAQARAALVRTGGRRADLGAHGVQALRDVVDVKAGQRVLVIGAGGGVGTLAVQIAKAFGAARHRRVQRHEGGTGPLVRAPTT